MIFRDTEDDRLIDENDLYIEYKNGEHDPEITFDMFINNCLDKNGFLELYKMPDSKELFGAMRVCEHCYNALKSHGEIKAGYITYPTDIDSDIETYCYMCDSLHNDIIYEI